MVSSYRCSTTLRESLRQAIAVLGVLMPAIVVVTIAIGWSYFLMALWALIPLSVALAFAVRQFLAAPTYLVRRHPPEIVRLAKGKRLVTINASDIVAAETRMVRAPYLYVRTHKSDADLCFPLCTQWIHDPARLLSLVDRLRQRAAGGASGS